MADFDVITSTSVEEAWAILERRQPEVELVLSDIVMPGSIDGPELAEKIHQLDPDLPVLFISGALSAVDPRTAKMAEEQLLLRKPFNPKQLIDFVRAHLRGTSSGIVR
jgi:DNA-binding response OmpR family regulator